MNNTNTHKSIPQDAVVRRLYARGTWKLDSAAHFGGEESGIADMCLLRDHSGNPFIPAASIAGAARNYLARKKMIWMEYSQPNSINQEPELLIRLFGGSQETDAMSTLIVADAKCMSEDVNTYIRDGVRIVRESGTAADGAKYDVEVVERGTEFQFKFQCIIREVDNTLELTELFLAMLYGFQQGDIQLGARTRRGYGQGKVKSWDVYDLRMNNPQHVLAWLQDKPESIKKRHLKPRPLLTDQRKYFRIEADFQLVSSLLIRSASTEPDETDSEHLHSNGKSNDTDDIKYKVSDMVHLHSNGKPIIPGTSFTGAFRHRANLIADAIGWEADENDEDLVCEMFGPIHKQDSKVKQQTDLWASRVTIEEHIVENVKPQWQDRVAIDRFTGGSLQSALFNEKPAYPCPIKAETETNVRLSLILEEPEKAEIGLLLLTLRDFWYGHAALGGETSNGRGTLQGITAKLIYKDDPNPENTKEWKLQHKDKRMTIECDDEGFLQSCVDKAQNNKERPEASRRPDKENSEEKTDAE